MLDLKRLRFLREVAERGTVTAAAEALAYTPSAVSQQISILEEEIGTPLLERQGRNVALTPAGKILIAYSDEIFDAVERATTAISEAADDVAGRVVVGALQSVMATLLPETVRTLFREHPRVDLHLVEMGHNDASRELRLGALDVAVDASYSDVPNRSHRGLIKHKIMNEPLYLAVPTASPIKSLRDAADAHWAAASLETCDCGRAVRSICRKAGFEPEVQFETDNYEVSLQLVASIDTVAILPALAVGRKPKGVRLIPIPGVTRQIMAVTRQAAEHRPAVTAFIKHMQQAAKTRLPDISAA